MGAKYLLRFDDICPTMNWSVWDRLEEIFLEHRVKPILAVVPDNRDPHLAVDPPREGFWERVRSWQAQGWTIGLHGYQHTYVTDQAGIIGLNKRSEFSGLSREQQSGKIAKGIAIFRSQGVIPQAWIAPAHSFDQITVEVLRQHGIRAISDGFFLSPRLDRHGTLWMPQQLWNFRRLPFGVWTCCFHHNSWQESDIRAFRENVARYSGAITGWDEATAGKGLRRKSPVDGLVAAATLRLITAKAAVRGFLSRPALP